MAETKPELITPAWRMKMLNQAYDAGLLMANEGRVYFITQSGDILFEADKQDVKAKWPWWEFGGGVRLTAGGKVYRIYFTRPQGADTGPDWSNLAGNPLIPPQIQALVLPVMGYQIYRDSKEALRNAKAWREYLGT